LYGAFRYRHWAGFSGNTHPFGLAATYVLVKQSEFPGHCDQPSSWLAPLLPKLRGQFAEFPRLDCADTPWTTHPGAPVLVLGTNTAAVNRFLFTGTGTHPKRAFALPLVRSSTSHHYGSSWSSTLGQTDESARTIQMRQVTAQRLRWCRNINLLPIRHSRLRNTLGSTNPRLMNIVEEP